MYLKLLSINLCLLVVLTGCSITTSHSDESESGVTTDRQLALKHWSTTNTANYQFTAQQRCYCLPKARMARTIVVKNHKVFEVRFTDSNELDLDPPKFVNKTINEWFQQLADFSNSESVTVSHRFHSFTGFPIHISVDRHPRMVDDEFTINFSNFTPLSSK